jgi:hypothetical protein
MHDLDRQQLEHYEDEGVVGESGVGPIGSELTESQELALASEVLEIASEAELEEFLGDLWNGTKAAASRVYNSAAVQKALPYAKAVGAKVLPVAAGKLADLAWKGSGDFVKAGAGALIDQWLKEELEGLSAEDRELALARRYVRFAHDALLRAARTPERVPPRVAGQVAVRDAARSHIPGVVPFLAQLNGGSPAGEPAAGRWVRRGSTIEIELA